MEQYISKSALVAEIDKLQLCTMDEHMNYYSAEAQGEYNALSKLESFLDTLEVKEVDNWHLQSKEDIDDALEDWEVHTFICLMKDGTIQKFIGIKDECYNGTINNHLYCAYDNYEWEYDDIVYWIETPITKAQKGEKV